MSEELIERFKEGQILIFPTDTLYGIGCIASKASSLRRLYEIKRRETEKPTLLLISDLKMASEYGHLHKDLVPFLKNFWPGPLTVVLKAKERAPFEICGSDGTIALRIPDQPYLLNLLLALNEAILAPSANFSGQKAPVDFSEIDRRLVLLVDYAIDLAQVNGKALTGLPSTIVDLTGEGLKVIREGSIKKSSLEKAFQKVQGGSEK